MKKKEFVSEEMEWLHMSPARRMLETTKLWKLYLALGGTLDPEPDPQSPFYFQEMSYRSRMKSETMRHKQK